MRLDYRGTVKEGISKELRADAIVTALQNATPAQINAWVDANVNNIADFKRIIKVILKLLATLSK